MKQRLKNGLQDKIGLIVAFFVIIIVFTIINPNYFSTQNLSNILTSASLTGLVAIAETLLIIAGLIDLSPGSVAAFSSVVAGFLATSGMPVWLVIPVTTLFGALIGAFNGWGYNRFKLEPFIITLASMSIFRGLGYILCGGKPVFINNPEFISIGSTRVVWFLTIPVIVLLVAFVIFAILLNKTRFGRSIYVLGGNKYAARLAGLNPAMITTVLFMISGALSALGGGLLAARMQSSQPSSCEGLEFDAITAVVLGGVAMSGGVGTIGGMILGVFIMQCFNTGLIMAQVPVFWQTVARGLLLLFALIFDFYRRKNYEKKMLLQSIQVTEEAKKA